MAYEQWIGAEINPKNITVTVRNPSTQFGKFYCGAMDNEIPPTNEDGVVVAPNDPFTLWSCGRDSAASGTQGRFDLYDGDTKLGTFTWDCPWGSVTNTWAWSSSSDDALVQVTGGSTTGAIGQLTLLVVKAP